MYFEKMLENVCSILKILMVLIPLKISFKVFNDSVLNSTLFVPHPLSVFETNLLYVSITNEKTNKVIKVNLNWIEKSKKITENNTNVSKIITREL